MIFDEFGILFVDVIFVVVDLEIIGGFLVDCGIIEVGVVKVRGGEVFVEFYILVNLGELILLFVALFIGIDDVMVVVVPCVEQMLLVFFEFVVGTVFVVYNVGFDVGFFKVACVWVEWLWSVFLVVDIVRLVWYVLIKEEVRDVKLFILVWLFCFFI